MARANGQELRPCPGCGRLHQPPGLNTGHRTAVEAWGQLEAASDGESRPPMPDALPNYAHREEGLDRALAGETAIIRCSCGEHFCYKHGNAHAAGVPCEVHETQIREADGASYELIASMETKECPSCGIAVDRAAGCNHVVCPSCKNDFCFRCGKGGLTGNYVRTCPHCSQGYVDHRRIPQARRWAYLLAPLWLPIAVAWFGVTLAFGIACLGGCCVCCGRLATESEETIWDAIQPPPSPGTEGRPAHSEAGVPVYSTATRNKLGIIMYIQCLLTPFLMIMSMTGFDVGSYSSIMTPAMRFQYASEMKEESLERGLQPDFPGDAGTSTSATADIGPGIPSNIEGIGDDIRAQERHETKF